MRGGCVVTPDALFAHPQPPVVEVSPSYDHAEITSLAAATIAFEMTMLLQKSPLAMGRKLGAPA